MRPARAERDRLEQGAVAEARVGVPHPVLAVHAQDQVAPRPGAAGGRADPDAGPEWSGLPDNRGPVTA